MARVLYKGLQMSFLGFQVTPPSGRARQIEVLQRFLGTQVCSIYFLILLGIGRPDLTSRVGLLEKTMM